MMNKPDFLHIDAEKILMWAWSKMGVATLSQEGIKEVS